MKFTAHVVPQYNTLENNLEIGPTNTYLKSGKINNFIERQKYVLVTPVITFEDHVDEVNM